MAEGTPRWFNEATGYGLIRPDDGGRALIVRGTDIASEGFDPLEEGAAVSYEVKRGSALRAFNVSVRSRCEGKKAHNGY